MKFVITVLFCESIWSSNGIRTEQRGSKPESRAKTNMCKHKTHQTRFHLDAPRDVGFLLPCWSHKNYTFFSVCSVKMKLSPSAQNNQWKWPPHPTTPPPLRKLPRSTSQSSFFFLLCSSVKLGLQRRSKIGKLVRVRLFYNVCTFLCFSCLNFLV